LDTFLLAVNNNRGIKKMKKMFLVRVMAVLAALNVPTMAEDFVFSRNLTLGDKGTEVAALQTYLESKGYLVFPQGVAKGYFGVLTRASVRAYQIANGIHPPLGYFGPITRAQVNAMKASEKPQKQ
jgi:peptidoglycan hydrolase-like protein with peptidoglycan-binding domain